MSSTEGEVPQMPIDEVVSQVAGDTEIQEVQMDGDETEVRSEAVHLVGVNDLSHEQVKEFAFEHTRSPFAIEWINDTSLNIAFDDKKDGEGFLAAISQEGQGELPLKELRSTKSHPTVACNFQARIANNADVKPVGSKHESKYYKEHGAPSIRENRIRFGTARSEPMKYARGDILKGVRKKTKGRSRDLFPHLAKGDGSDDLFPHLANKSKGNNLAPEDDLFPHLVKGGGIQKKSNRRVNKKKNLDAMEDVEQAVAADTKSVAKPEAQAVYSNMDY